MTDSASTFRVVILMPVYQDWECASMVCQSLGEALSGLPQVSARILLVDDGSPDGLEGWPPYNSATPLQTEVLQLRTNLGHQRAICVGICHTLNHLPCDAVVVMDADGEDRPEDAARLIELAMARPAVAVLAERRRRSAGVAFGLGYTIFRIVHFLLTGIPVRVGNFSVLPRSMLPTLTCMPELWNHYAGAVIKSRVRRDQVPFDRGRRLKGHSKMNIRSLVTHGIAGIATFSETVTTRILLANFFFVGLLCIVLAIVVGLRSLTELAIPGWATYTVGIILVLVVQSLSISFGLVFSQISNRTRLEFIPFRDYTAFVGQLRTLAEPP
jgi:glycosyltransferase involved in cell wall biosynthesis